MGVRHKFMARAMFFCHQNLGDVSKSFSNYYGRGCQMGTSGFHYGRKWAALTPAKVLPFVYTLLVTARKLSCRTFKSRSS
jgi:hypothetical protein